MVLKRLNIYRAILLIIIGWGAVVQAQWNEVEKLLSGDIETGDGFGYSVSISGDYTIIGAPFEGTTGAAYIFVRDGSGNWSEVTKLIPSDGESEDRFGYSVSIRGNHAIVGADLEYTGNEAYGAAYIFERDGNGNWNEVVKIQASDKEDEDQFGWSVSIDGDQAIVGAPSESTGAFWAGAAYIFERDGNGNWNEITKIQSSDKEFNDRFGSSVSISGDRVIIGAWLEGTGGFAAGSAYLYERDGSGIWNEVAKIQGSDTEAADGFGYSVSINSDRAIAGAFNEDTGGNDAGAAYIFELDGIGNWNEVAKIQSNDVGAGDNFGVSVSLSGDNAIVGAYREDTGGTVAGAAYVFERDGSGNWNEVTKILAGDRQFGDSFGNSVSISSNRAIVGAPFKNNVAGASYIFEQGTTGIHHADSESIPEKLSIHQNYPNPFNPSTTIRYSLPEHSKITIIIYNQLGQKVKTLVNQNQSAGNHQIDWDGKNEIGQSLSSGIYFYQLKAGDFIKTHKMVLLK